MAVLKDTQAASIDAQNVSVAGEVIRSTAPPYISVSKDDGGNAYGTVGPIPFNILYDSQESNILISNNNSRFTITEPGLYYSAFVGIGQNDSAGYTFLNIRKNGSDAGMVRARREGGTQYRQDVAFRVWEMQNGDYLEAELDAGVHYFNSAQYTTFLIMKVA